MRNARAPPGSYCTVYSYSREVRSRARSGSRRRRARASGLRSGSQARLHGWPLSRLNVKAIRCAPSRGRAHTKVTAARGRAASRSLRPRPRHCRRAAERSADRSAALTRAGLRGLCFLSRHVSRTCGETDREERMRVHARPHTRTRVLHEYGTDCITCQSKRTDTRSRYPAEPAAARTKETKMTKMQACHSSQTRSSIYIYLRRPHRDRQ